MKNRDELRNQMKRKIWTLYGMVGGSGVLVHLSSSSTVDADSTWCVYAEGTTGDMAARVNPYSSASSSEDSYFGANNSAGQE